MSTEHTPGLLKLVGAELRANGVAVALACSTEANAARLCACWNACAGINPEAVPDLLAAARAAIDRLKAENAALLAALEGIIALLEEGDAVSDRVIENLQAARAAIAAAEKGAKK